MFDREFQCLALSLAQWTRLRALQSPFAVLLFLMVLPPLAGTAQTVEPISPPVPIAPQQQEPVSASPTPLELAQPIRRELAGGERHFYQLSLEAGQAIEVKVHAEGIVTGASIVLPDGRRIDVYDATGNTVQLKLPWMAQVPGIYRFEVFGRNRAKPGSYQIELVTKRAATPDDRELQVARDLFNESRPLTAEGKFHEARIPLQRSLAIYERILGPEHLMVGNVLGYLAANYHITGELARALPLKQREARIYEARLGADSPKFGNELFQLAGYHLDHGDYETAVPIYERALGIFERSQHAETPQAATTLGMLGNTYYLAGDLPNALKYFERSRALWEQILGPDHFHLAPSYRYSGLVAYDAGDLATAESMFQRAIAINEKGMGTEHTSLTRYLNDLAMLRCTMGDFAAGEALYQRAIANHERKNNLGNPGVRVALVGLARCYAAEGKLTDAVKAQLRANDLTEQYLTINLAAGSEREKMVLLADLASDLSRNISLHTRTAPADPVARELAMTSILQRKGRIQDVLADSLAALRERSGPEDRALIEQLNTINAALSKLYLNAPVKAPQPDRQAQTDKLEKDRDSLEDQISRRSSGYFERSGSVSLAAVRAAIPGDAALIEFAVYRPFDPRAANKDRAYGPPRYAVYTVRTKGEINWADLGEASSIDASVAQFRQALRDPHRREVIQRARGLDQRLMQPIRSLVGDATRLLISPDGQLNLVPFAALIDERGKFLLERFEFTYLTNGRELLRLQTARESKGGPLVIANPQFGNPNSPPWRRRGRAPQVAGVVRSEKAPRSGPNSRLTTARDLTSVYFAPLANTELEARSIKAQFPEANILVGAQAKELALKQTSAPSILHIATHGFFLAAPDDGALPVGRKPRLIRRDAGASGMYANSLLRSGLALAEANLHHAGGDDGILTASEAAGLDLWGTKLVVLSACDTGVGEVRTGEGVYGLRRAFVLAGAESLVMSLWPISDYTTRAMMARYYEKLKLGLGRGAALRQVQLEMLRKDPGLHPFYWANFIQSGEWAGLQGRR